MGASIAQVILIAHVKTARNSFSEALSLLPTTDNMITEHARQHHHHWVSIYVAAWSVDSDADLCSAGIIGLNVALVLAERGFGKCITVVAEYLPGDTAVTYTSPWYMTWSRVKLVELMLKQGRLQLFCHLWDRRQLSAMGSAWLRLFDEVGIGAA